METVQCPSWLFCKRNDMVSVLNKLTLNHMFVIMDSAITQKAPEIIKTVRDHEHALLFFLLLFEGGPKLRAKYIIAPLGKDAIISDRIKDANKKLSRLESSFARNIAIIIYTDQIINV